MAATSSSTSSKKAAASTTAKGSTSTYSPVLITSFPSQPLTAIYTPPADCKGIYLSSSVDIVGGQSSCFPSGFSAAATAFFSPGIDCPSGYYTACHDTTGLARITTVTCCPVQSGISLTCANPATLSGVSSTLFCEWEAPATATTLAFTLSSGGITSTVTSAISSPRVLNAHGVRMVYQSSDVASAARSSTASRQPTSTAPASSGSSGLSTGGIAAIAVVIPLVAIAALVGAYMWWRRRRKIRFSVVPADDTAAGKGGVLSYFSFHTASDRTRSPAMEQQQSDQQYRAYQPGWGEPEPQENRLSELPPTESPAELPGDNTR